MMSGMYAAISGLDAHQTMLDVTANNLANVDTVGYKAQRVEFSDELSQLDRGRHQRRTATAPAPTRCRSASASRSARSITTWAPAAVETTGNATDVAIQGNGWLRVANGNVSTTPPTFDATQYTRAGDLTTNSRATCAPRPVSTCSATVRRQNADHRHTTARTRPGGTNNPIIIPPGSTNVTIGADGSVNYQNASGTTVTAGYISLATFPNQAGLQRDGGSLWSPTAASGAETVGQPGTGNFGQTISGELEQSNVDMGTEFTNMIEAERGYQANAARSPRLIR